MKENELINYTCGLLLRIQEAKNYHNACLALNKLYRQQDCVSQIKIAGDFFAVTIDAVNYAMMMAATKLCDEDNDSYSVLRFINRCQSDSSFQRTIGDKKAFKDIITSFYDVYNSERVKSIMRIMRLRRDKHYAHDDKKYFFDTIEKLLEEGALPYDDIIWMLDQFEDVCKKIYALAAGKAWVLPQMFDRHNIQIRNCMDIIDLVERVQL